MTDFNAIAADLEICDMVQALGDRKSKRKATAHRKACFAAIAEANRADGLDNISDDELLAELFT